MLSLQDVHVYYGDSHILQGISLTVGTGELVTLLGRNGAGKTTTMRAIMGLVYPRGGTITFAGHDISHLPPYLTARLGIGYVPDRRGIIPGLTVEENLRLPTLREPRRKREFQDRMTQLLDFFPRLKERWRQEASSLSGGEQQMLAIARALVTRPPLLLVDEPTQGLAPLLVRQIMEMLLEINRTEKTSILLIEQNAAMALEFSERAYVIDQGRIQLEGATADIRADREVQRRYLGA